MYHATTVLFYCHSLIELLMLNNSTKYTKRGTVAVSVRCEPNGVEGHFPKPCVVFGVSDTGNGVRAEDKDRLFQKFIRGQGSALVHTEGTGLGLYVGRMMVEAFGRAGGGTTPLAEHSSLRGRSGWNQRAKALAQHSPLPCLSPSRQKTKVKSRWRRCWGNQISDY